MIAQKYNLRHTQNFSNLIQNQALYTDMTSPNANDISFLTEATEANATHNAIDLTAWLSNVTQIQNTDAQTPGILHRLKATRLGKFYLTYLKKYPLIRWLVITLWRTGFPIHLKINVPSLSIFDHRRLCQHRHGRNK